MHRMLWPAASTDIVDLVVATLPSNHAHATVVSSATLLPRSYTAITDVQHCHRPPYRWDKIAPSYILRCDTRVIGVSHTQPKKRNVSFSHSCTRYYISIFGESNAPRVIPETR